MPDDPGISRIADFGHPGPDAVEASALHLVSGLPIQIYRASHTSQVNSRRGQILIGANVIGAIEIGFPATCAARAVQERGKASSLESRRGSIFPLVHRDSGPEGVGAVVRFEILVVYNRSSQRGFLA